MSRLTLFEVEKAKRFRESVIGEAIAVVGKQKKYLDEEAHVAPGLTEKVEIFRKALRRLIALHGAKGYSVEQFALAYKKIIDKYFSDTNLHILAIHRGNTPILTPIKDILIKLIDKFARHINNEKYRYGFFKGSSLRAGEYLAGSVMSDTTQKILNSHPTFPSPLAVKRGS